MNDAREKHIYTVSELTKYIRMLLEDSFPTAWVEGEISNFILHSSGHMYFSIKDSAAVLKCAMFKRSNERLAFRPKDGMKVICFGKVSVYEARGDYQLIVEEIEPKGIGALQLKFEELKKRLSKEGLFEAAHKVPIPYLPTRVGVVTSPTGAAIKDILNIARRRFSNVEIIINPVRVQGDGAAEEIAEAIRLFNRLQDIDVMIVGRGGGSLEDLWAFNEEAVARAIYASDIPVISAVGHEIDYTISDFVADFRAPTPSAAAELVIPRKEDLASAVSGLKQRLKTVLISRVNILREKLATLKESYIMRQPLNIIVQHEQRVDDLRRVMATEITHMVEMAGENFKLLAGKLGALSPLAILTRGYSVTMRLPERAIIKDSRELKADDIIETKLGRGRVVSRVEKTEAL